jgi:plastocyanin
MFGASGCDKDRKYGKNTRTFACGDQTIEVNTNDGAKPQAVYVCEGNTVTWNPNGNKFLVEFRKDSPFEDGGKKFDNEHPKSAKTKRHEYLTVYEYSITVGVGSQSPRVFADPQVIGGGGN